MGSYIGHCESCDISLTAEEIVSTIQEDLIFPLVDKYGVEKTKKIVVQLRREMNQLSDDWFVRKPSSIEESIAALDAYVKSFHKEGKPSEKFDKGKVEE